MFTLETLSKQTGAKINPLEKGDIVLSVGKARNMFFSGRVLWHLTMRVDGYGLNGTGTWPAYLVNDEGKLKVVWA